MNNKYEDLLHMPHHVSKTHPQMSMQNRAAQFSPFAALVGYDDLIVETARLTDQRMELDESVKAELNERLRLLLELLPQRPEVSITYFQPDCKKAGGSYQSTCGIVRKYLLSDNALIMTDGVQIPVNEIISLEGSCFFSFDSNRNDEFNPANPFLN